MPKSPISTTAHAESTSSPDRGTVSLVWFLSVMLGAIAFLVIGSVIAESFAKEAPYLSPLVTASAVVIALAYRFGAHRWTAVIVTAASFGVLTGIAYAVLYEGSDGSTTGDNVFVGAVGLGVALLAAAVLAVFDRNDGVDRSDSKAYVALGAFVIIFASACDFAAALAAQ